MLHSEARSVAVTGASGMVGSALCQNLAADRWTVLKMVRQSSPRDLFWDYSTRQIDSQKLDGVQAVVHLAGENIAGGRWNDARKQRIRNSRVQGTRFLCESLAKLANPPAVLVCASAIGFYGNRRDAILGEDSPPGSGFLPEVCVEWEKATQAAIDRGIRVVNIRIGIILSRVGGALQKMLLPFKLGLGGRVGSGAQYWSWVSLPDIVGITQHVIETQTLTGPVNAVSPNPVTNSEFTRTLGKVLGRPTLFPMPAFAARLAFGEMATALMLASARVAPLRLRETGYHFKFQDLESALRNAIYE